MDPARRRSEHATERTFGNYGTTVDLVAREQLSRLESEEREVYYTAGKNG